MDVVYEICGDECYYVEGFKRYRKTKPLRHVFLLIKLLGLTLFSFLIWVLISEKVFSFAAIIFAMCLIIVFSYKIDHLVIKRNVRNSPYGNEDAVLTFSEHGLYSKSDKAEVKLGWDVFTKAIRVKDGFLLFQGPKHYNWLPDNKLTNHAQLDQIRELFEKNV
ncbi:hypothetical protein GCM10008090_24640 [Arenicella chitinivorans]|uniref:YcxB-like C-terminal domain-containing protein n=1 Tax=Arenicella chitinivorans TaxID=1329800 RepID=A0A918RVB5_9GAMM|nr:hypothetical protein GCM10008090_24640 [Arenicella chitinivorans]